MDKSEELKRYRLKSIIDKVFSIGIVIKGIDGLIGLVAGFLLFLLTPDSIHNLIVLATHREITEDHHDFIANPTLTLLKSL